MGVYVFGVCTRIIQVEQNEYVWGIPLTSVTIVKFVNVDPIFIYIKVSLYALFSVYFSFLSLKVISMCA